MSPSPISFSLSLLLLTPLTTHSLFTMSTDRTHPVNTMSDAHTLADEEKGLNVESPSTSSPMTLSWSDLSYVTPKRERPILSGISGSITSGRLLAGESGTRARTTILLRTPTRFNASRGRCAMLTPPPPPPPLMLDDNSNGSFWSGKIYLLGRCLQTSRRQHRLRTSIEREFALSCAD